MSHSVTVTRTTTTNTTSAIFINTGYLKTAAGLLKLLQLIGNAVIFGLLCYHHRNSYAYNVPATFLELMSCTFLICTFCLLLSCVFSLSTGGLISKTLYEFIYHLTAAILLLIASITFYVKIERYSRFSFYGYYLSAAIIGFVNAILYFISTLLAFREYRN